MYQRRPSGGFAFVLAVSVLGLGSVHCDTNSSPKLIELQAPSNLTYASNPAVYTLGAPIPANAPSSSGGAVASYSVMPELPAGLSLDTSTGVISGTPTAITPLASYTVTASNSGGQATASLSISVNDVAPSNLVYPSNPAVYTKGTGISANRPSSSGGTVTGYSVSPSLPAGLLFSSSTGAISGTPTVVAATANYTVTASNSGGQTTASLTITVNDVAPSNLVYTSNPAVYTKGTGISANLPSNSGGAVTGYAVSPSLPAGLALNPSTGAISGTPTAVVATASYTVTASNSGGQTTASLSITVNDVAPSSLTYSSNPAVYTKGTPIPPNLPSNGGGTVTGYAVSPGLPAGLALNPSTGAISGTPTAVVATASYTVTATNTGGHTTVSLSMTVNDLPPTGLTYSSNPAAYTKGTPIPLNVPSNSGGGVGMYSVSPALPAGLALSATTGIISGTPTAVTAAAAYTVTASNSAGSTTVSLTITVNDVAPSNLTYSSNPAVYTKGKAIAANTPSNGGGTVTGYSVSPSLPAGLALSASTGVISGTPTVVVATGSYVVTASNSGGQTTVSVSITVNDVAPSNLTYSSNPAVYTKGTLIPNNTPSSVGGTVTGYSVSPSLPAGLALSASTGVISGTPTAVVATASYVVTASNSGGQTTLSVSITVNDVAPSNLTYSSNPAVYTKGTPIPPNVPSNGGGTVLSYAVSPSLPAGLSLNAGTGEISGTPSAITAAAGYTVTASNSGGSTTVSVSITVNDVAPSNLTYSSNPATYTIGTPIPNNTPSNSGGAVTGYSVSPALPAGLAFSTTTGVISGTPTVVAATASYTVKASNSGGSTTVSVSITVNNAPPTNLKYSSNPASYPVGTLIPNNTPSNSGGTVTGYSVSPSLPAGLALSATTGVISGTPTTVTATATYTVTASNSVGSTTVGLTITVTDIPPTNLTYSSNPAVYTVGTLIPVNVPSNSGGTVTGYSVSPGLPAGLALDASTGVISGIPTAVTTTASYTVTASNSGGSTQASVSITVNARLPVRFGFVANRGDNTVSMYTVNASTGELRANGYVAAGTTPISVAVDPTQKFAYVANLGTNTGTVSAYTINSTTGVLTPVGAAVAAGAAPTSVAVDPSGKFVYVTNSGTASNNVSAYSINASTGALTSLGTTAAGSTPISVTVDPTGRFAYVVNQGSNTISAYTISPGTGALASVGSVATGVTPISVTVDPSGRFAYVADTGTTSGDVAAYSINASTGALTSVGPNVAAQTGPNSISIDPTGTFVYVSNTVSNSVSIYSINATTGALTSVDTPAPADGPSSVAVDPSGSFAYVTNFYTNEVSTYTIDASTGALAQVQTMSTRGAPNSIALAQGATAVAYIPKFAYAANYTSNNVSAYTINASTGALSAVGAAVAAGTNPSSVAVDPFGRFAYVTNYGSNNVSVYTIDASTGALSAVGSAVAAGTQPISVAVDPTGSFAYVANYGSGNVSAYTIDQSTGALSGGATLTAGTNPNSVAVDPSGRFVYVANYGSGDVAAFSLASGTGVLTSVGANVAAGTNPYSVAVDATGNYVYVANYGSNNVSIFVIASSSGALSADGAGATVGAGTTPTCIAVDPAGSFAYVANSSTVWAYSVSSTNGELANVGTTSVGGSLYSVAVDPSGRFAYVANSGSNNVSAYTINASNGTLGGGTTAGAGTNPHAVTTTGTIQ
ncbi:MAG: beta-propeller fold lactonase family protein [Myxococcaceae bacterium]